MAASGDHCHEEHLHEAMEEPPTSGPRPRLDEGHARRWFLAIILALTLTLVVASVAAFLSLGSRPEVRLSPGATIYFNEACSDCLVYLNDELTPALARAGVAPVVVKDYINDRTYREELTGLNAAMGIPFELQSHLATFVSANATTAFEGHVPAVLIEEALAINASARPTRLLVYQDSMDVIESYRAWGFAGPAQTYPITTPISTYVAWYVDNVGSLGGPMAPTSILPIVLATGLLDGLNPCAFAVLLFFVSFLYAVRAPRVEVLRMGSTYAYAVFLIYFLIGLGLLRAIVISDDPHLIARIAAVAVIALGAMALLRLAFPRLPSLSVMPSAMWPRIRERILQGSLPSATVAGLLVGLCTFPCSGGVYVAILGLLAANTTFLQGLAFLYLYNAMYILPLFVVLAGVSNRRAALAAAKWERAHAKAMKAAMAATMLAMGAFLLVVSL